jgi:hypothetical protein
MSLMPSALLLVLLIVLAAGCDRLLGISEVPEDGAITHPKLDGNGSSPDVQVGTCYGLNGQGNTGLLQICNPQVASTAPLTLTGGFATDSDARCTEKVVGDAGKTWSVCVVAAPAITVGDLTVTGTRPLVLLGLQDLRVVTKLTTFAGAGWSGCPVGGFGIGTTSGGTGAAGGSFVGPGGAGGGITNTGGPPPTATQIPRAVRGGCSGAKGGGGAGGGGGLSGGAIYLISGTTLEVEGKILATGMGGVGGGPNSTGGFGGGGGGSGGLIGLDAKQISFGTGAVLSVNGGGGGGGGNASAGGGVGEITDPTDPTMAPGGGKPATGAQTGGIGAGGTSISGGTALSGMPGGGGGGGGGGAVLFYSPDVTGMATISPMVSQ